MANQAWFEACSGDVVTCRTALRQLADLRGTECIRFRITAFLAEAMEALRTGDAPRALERAKGAQDLGEKNQLPTFLIYAHECQTLIHHELGRDDLARKAFALACSLRAAYAHDWGTWDRIRLAAIESWLP